MDVGLNNKNTLGEIAPEFTDVVFFIEATSNEQFTLWQEWSKDSMNNIKPLSDAMVNTFPEHIKAVVKPLNDKVNKLKHTRVNWKQVSSGFSIVIGQIKKMPVNVSFSFAFINGRKVCFYDCTSRMADYTMIHDWLIERFQLTHDKYTRWNHCNSSNFHNCVNSLDSGIDIKPRNTIYKK